MKQVFKKVNLQENENHYFISNQIKYFEHLQWGVAFLLPHATAIQLPFTDEKITDRTVIFI